MKKKIIIPIGIIFIILLIIILILLLSKKEYIDPNTLYSIKFGNIELRFKHIDYTIVQNQMVIVEKSVDNGKTFEKITENAITVSLKPKFVFFNENYGFAIKKPNNLKENGKYYGGYVTKDGGKSFKQFEIIYDNPDIEILTIEDVPFYDNGKLKLHCSIYTVKSDKSGYETKDLYFITDDGETWYLERELSLSIKENTLTCSGGTFILKNNTDEDYTYDPAYYIEKMENDKWQEIKLEEPLTWNTVLYTLKAKEEKEININWGSTSYGMLESGKYRLVKTGFRKNNSPDSRSYSLYSEFTIPKVIAGTANTIIVEKNNIHDTNKYNIYLKRDGKKVYFASNIKEIYYDNVKNKYVLKDYIEKTYQTLDDSINHLINSLSLYSELNDGGTKIYKSKEYDITIVKCNTVTGNHDYYIGDYNLNTDGILMCQG